jgi:hypothetical protein
MQGTAELALDDGRQGGPGLSRDRAELRSNRTQLDKELGGEVEFDWRAAAGAKRFGSQSNPPQIIGQAEAGAGSRGLDRASLRKRDAEGQAAEAPLSG